MIPTVKMTAARLLELWRMNEEDLAYARRTGQRAEAVTRSGRRHSLQAIGQRMRPPVLLAPDNGSES
jgi:hypothetical protein